MTVAVDLGSGTVKVATDAGAPIRLVPPVDPELAARVGTTVPLIRRDGGLVITQAPHDAYVRAVATSLNGTTAESVAIVTPDWWTQRARAMVEETLESHEPGRFQLVSPAVAAISAASESRRLPSTVAVLDIGAESSSSTILAKDDGAHHVVGRPAVLHGQAGTHIDRRLMQLVLGWLSTDVHSDESTGPEIAAAGKSLQTQVKTAKERLSTRPVATLTPNLPGANVELRLVRSEFDEVVRETVDAIVAMLKANIVVNMPEGVEAVLLTGGSVSIPLVPQVISAELGLPVILEDDPATLAVRGAATVEVPAPRQRRGWPPRRKRAARLAFSLENAPVPESEALVDPTPMPAKTSPVPPGRHVASESVVPQEAGQRLDSFVDISRRQAAATQAETAVETARLVVDTGSGRRSRRSTRWASAPESETSWNSARRVYVDDQGHLRFTINDRQHDMDLGMELASSSVTMILMGLHVFVTVTETGELLRELMLDPDQEFRPE